MSAHTAKLRRDVEAYVQGKDRPKLADVVKHITAKGWRMADTEMFAGWLKEQGIRVEE